MKRTFLVIISFLLLISCENEIRKTSASDLIGEWVNAYGGSNKLVFKESGEFQRYFNGTLKGGKFFQKDSTGMFVEHDYGIFQYKIQSIHQDSILCNIVGSKNKAIYAKRIYIPTEDHLVEISYKSLPGIEHHIDEIGYYKKAGTLDIKTSKGIVEKIILPQGYFGNIHIAYNQQDGAPVELDEWGNRILSVPKNGLLKTKLKEDPIILAMDRFEFYEVDSVSNTLIPLREYQHGVFRNALNTLQNKDQSLVLKYDPDSTAVFVWGFNQYARKRRINIFFNEVIEGNVLSLEVDTIKSRLRLDWYSGQINN